MPELLPCPECGQAIWRLKCAGFDDEGDWLYRCPVCGSTWTTPELEMFVKEEAVYQPLETDVSGRNYQEEMRTMVDVMIPVYESVTKAPGKGPGIIKEFNDMLEFSGATVTGVDDRAKAVTDYLNYHYYGYPPPLWYANLTGEK